MIESNFSFNFFCLIKSLWDCKNEDTLDTFEGCLEDSNSCLLDPFNLFILKFFIFRIKFLSGVINLFINVLATTFFYKIRQNAYYLIDYFLENFYIKIFNNIFMQVINFENILSSWCPIALSPLKCCKIYSISIFQRRISL